MYSLLDSGDGRKLERFGEFVLARPCAQAFWRPALSREVWARADASFDREDGNRWDGRDHLPDHWILDESGIKFHLSATDFGHLGIFPEQRAQWAWLRKIIGNSGVAQVRVLNLFAYSGGSSLACALAGAAVTHLDASRGMVEWASENAKLNGVDSIRWIVDDAHKFLHREIKRGHTYEGIILDPPSFGRSEGRDMYKIERDFSETLALCRAALSDTPLFILASAHTPGCTAQTLSNLLAQTMSGHGGGRIESGEMLLTGADSVLPLPSGTYGRWVK